MTDGIRVGRTVQGDVTNPYRCKAKLIGAPGKLQLKAEVDVLPFPRLQGENHTNRQP